MAVALDQKETTSQSVSRDSRVILALGISASCLREPVVARSVRFLLEVVASVCQSEGRAWYSLSGR